MPVLLAVDWCWRALLGELLSAAMSAAPAPKRRAPVLRGSVIQAMNVTTGGDTGGGGCPETAGAAGSPILPLAAPGHGSTAPKAGAKRMVKAAPSAAASPKAQSTPALRGSIVRALTPRSEDSGTGELGACSELAVKQEQEPTSHGLIEIIAQVNYNCGATVAGPVLDGMAREHLKRLPGEKALSILLDAGGAPEQAAERVQHAFKEQQREELKADISGMLENASDEGSLLKVAAEKKRRLQSIMLGGALEWGEVDPKWRRQEMRRGLPLFKRPHKEPVKQDSQPQQSTSNTSGGKLQRHANARVGKAGGVGAASTALQVAVGGVLAPRTDGAEAVRDEASEKLEAERRRLAEGLEARLPPPGQVPPFDPRAYGTPYEWNKVVEPLFWGRRTSRYFEAVPGAVPDVQRVLEFLQMRRGPLGRPISERLALDKFETDYQGWFCFPWADFSEADLPQTSTCGLGPADWQRAYHGCKFEALYSIMYHGKLAASNKPERGDRFFARAPGVYCHKMGTCPKIGNYMRFVPLCRDGVFWAACWEVAVDRSDSVPVGNTDQWVQEERSVRLTKLYLAGTTYQCITAGWEVSRVWDPLLECNPFAGVAS